MILVLIAITFYEIQTDGSNTLTLDEFRKGLKEMKTNLVEREIMTLFAFLGTPPIECALQGPLIRLMNHLDKKGDGIIYFDSFIASIRVRIAVDVLWMLLMPLLIGCSQSEEEGVGYNGL